MSRFHTLMLVMPLALAACEGDKPPPKPPEFAEVFPNLPLPPRATFVSRAGGEDALQITLRSPVAVEQIEAYYRQTFKTKGWRLVNDARDGSGGIVLFVEQDGPPLWVRIRKEENGPGTLIDLAGAKVKHKPDSTRAITPAKPTS
jgi:hypothetical protein